MVLSEVLCSFKNIIGSKHVSMNEAQWNLSISTQMYRYSRLTLLIVIFLCCGTYVWVYETSRQRLVIQVRDDAPIYELTRLVHQYKEQLDYLREHPKVVFRCLDDEPKIKYPRHASDDLTEMVMATNDECGNVTTNDAVMIVHTSADHFQRRARFRTAYSDFNRTKPFRLKVVFLIGTSLDANIQIELEKENRQYGDTVIGSFMDTYQNLTLKAVMGYRWLATTCPQAKLVIKMDDDVFFDVRKFFTRYWNRIANSKKKKAIHCLVWHNAQVGRSGKWKVERGLFANASYPFPYCAGFFAVVTPDLIQPMYEYGKSIDFFWIDDVYLYGMVPNAIKGVHYTQIGRKNKVITEIYKYYKTCRETKGVHRCPYFAAVTDGENEFDEEFDQLWNPRPVNLTVPETVKANETEKSGDLRRKEIQLPVEVILQDGAENKVVGDTQGGKKEIIVEAPKVAVKENKILEESPNHVVKPIPKTKR